MPTNVPIDLLRTVSALARLRSYTKTAEELGVTQSAISEKMRRLRRCLSYDIFDKSIAGVHFTPRGMEMLKQAEKIVEISSQLSKEAGHAGEQY
jgi:DNA-binding transcriptional LysR family regulator